MRYFLFGYTANVPDGRVCNGSQAFNHATFPSRAVIAEKIAVTTMFGVLENIVISSVYEFNNEEDFLNYI